MKAANRIGKSRSRGGTDFIKYLGLEEVFRVVGPMGHGAMMGQTSKFGYKNIERVRQSLPSHKHYTAFQKDCDPAIDDLYIIKFVYFLGAPVPYKSRRALVCWGIVKSPQRNKIVNEGIKLAKSLEFKRKITLWGYEEEFYSDLLEFVGIRNIVPVFEKLRAGNCFIYNSMNMKSIKEIDRVVLPGQDEFKVFFKP